MKARRDEVRIRVPRALAARHEQHIRPGRRVVKHFFCPSSVLNQLAAESNQ